MSEVTDINEAEKIAQSEGGPKQDRASVMRDNAWSSDKMENELEMQKADKTKATTPEEIAGRKEKGSMTKWLEKLTPENKEKPNTEKKKKYSGKTTKKPMNKNWKTWMP